MQGVIWDFLSREGFQPHGYCLLWQPEVFWLHVVSDAAIVLAYFSIPVALIYLASKRRDLVYGWVLYLFGAFIIGCALTHAMGVWTMWVPDYGLQGLVKAATAVVSVVTAVALWPLMPRLLALPSTSLLEAKNAALAAEVAERRSAERALAKLAAELERRVEARTAELERANAELEAARARADEMNALKSQFLATMSHELRTPMNGVLGMLELLARSDLDDDQAKLVGVARDSADGLLVLLNDILDFSKLEAGAVTLADEPFSPAETLERVAALLRPRAEAAGLSLDVRAAADLPATLSGDGLRLGQVLINLVGNAIKFTESGGVTVSLRWRPAPDGGAELRCLVRDSGVGIARTAQGRLFQRFSQVDGSSARRFGGAGLGLAITRQLVELMGGRIGVRSAPGRGATFFFTVRCGPAAAAASGVAAPSPAPARPMRLLVAEDNPVNQLYVERLLSMQGHAVTVVSDGRAAVETARARAFDAILMDVSMPELDGPDAVAVLRGLSPPVTAPVIAMTAHAMAGDREALLAQGMDDYVSKPINPDALSAALARALALAEKRAADPDMGSSQARHGCDAA